MNKHTPPPGTRSKEYQPSDDGEPVEVVIRATEYEWTDPDKLPERDWLYGRLIIRDFVTATVAPGATGKTSTLTAEYLAMASCKPLLGITPPKRLKVWVLNLEDPIEESRRKVQATALHYGLKRENIAGHLFMDAGNENFVIAETIRGGATIIKPRVDAIIKEAKRLAIDVIGIDPFVSCHHGMENDNSAQDMVVKEWARVAREANVAVHLSDHTRKLGDSEITVESARGAKSKTDACREVRIIAKMTKEEAEEARIEVEHRGLYFRAVLGKPNLSRPTEKWDWYKLNSVSLGNGKNGAPGDEVGVVAKWKFPDVLADVTVADFDRCAAAIRAGKWRAHHSSKDWVGRAVAETMNLDLANKHDRKKVKEMLAMWKKAGSIIQYEDRDENSEIRPYVRVKD
jgi:hypothetical protein